MVNAADLTGMRFGNLTALRPTEERKSGQVVWECKCDCGNTAFVKRQSLRNGDTRSCGCLNRGDLTGRRFGKLTVVRMKEKRPSGNIRWECKCDCGNTANVFGNALVSGKTASCGCLGKNDLTGRRFGRLVAIRETAERRNDCVMWECLCDCGKTVHVRSHSLMTGATRSCGCLRKDMGQRAPILKEGAVFNKSISPLTTEIIFTDEEAPANTIVRDVSAKGRGSVVSWVDGTTMYVSSQRKGVKVIANEDSSGLFMFKSNVRKMDLSMLDVSKAKDMSGMFWMCTSLTELDISSWDVSRAEDMNAMFSECKRLSCVGDVAGWNVSRVKDMEDLFNNCKRLSLDCSAWNIPKVKSYRNFNYNAGGVIAPRRIG